VQPGGAYFEQQQAIAIARQKREVFPPARIREAKPDVAAGVDERRLDQEVRQPCLPAELSERRGIGKRVRECHSLGEPRRLL